MEKIMLFAIFLLLPGSAFTGDMPYQTQIQMFVPPTQPKHVATKEYADTADIALDEKISNIESDVTEFGSILVGKSDSSHTHPAMEVAISGKADATVLSNYATTEALADALENLADAPGVPVSRTVSVTTPLNGGGDLSADLTLGISAATAATASAAGSAGSAVYAPDSNTTARDMAATPAGVQAALNARITYGTAKMNVGDPLPAGTVYFQY